LKTLVVGLGNPILTDDGVGIYVVRDAAARCRRSDVTFAEASVGGLRLLDRLAGHERIIIVDAIQTRGGQPGDIYRFKQTSGNGRLRPLHPDDFCASLHSGSTHDLSLCGALALGRGMGMVLPADEDILIIAIEVEDVLNFGEQCTPAVAAAVPCAVEAVLDELGVGSADLDRASVSGGHEKGMWGSK
jgi:hydrogenase maturation protease